MERSWIPITSPLLGREEVAAARRVLLSGRVSQGPEVEALEAEFASALRVRHAVAVSSGSAALELVFRALGIGPGDEVITTPFTFFSTVASVLNVGALPVLVDIDPVTSNIDVAQVSSAITTRTAAVLPVHLYGRPAALDELLSLCRRHGLVLVEDACQAVGATFRERSVGSFGIGCFSFHGSKNITCGEGGMVTTGNHSIARRLRQLRSHAAQRQHRHATVSSNFRLTDLQAAVLRVQLSRLGGITRKRQRIARFYDRALSETAVIAPPPNDAVFSSCYHLYTVRLRNRREALRSGLKRRGIDSRVYYPRPVYRQPAWRGDEYRLPFTESACREVVSIPVHSALSSGQADYIAEAVARVAGAA